MTVLTAAEPGASFAPGPPRASSERKLLTWTWSAEAWKATSALPWMWSRRASSRLASYLRRLEPAEGRERGGWVGRGRLYGGEVEGMGGVEWLFG